MASSGKKYELILLGASGYTGMRCAEHIALHLPTNLSWAIAGRSSSKLESLKSDLTKLNADRVQPNIEIVNLTKQDLQKLVQKTRLVINTVGPYHLYSTPVVEACAENGTHYLDVHVPLSKSDVCLLMHIRTGEVPWVLDMISKFHDTARANNAIIIPEIGIESAPADLLTWLLVTHIRQQFSVGTKEVVLSIHSLKGSFSGGTLATVLSILDYYSIGEIIQATKPWAMSPVNKRKVVDNVPLLTRYLGVRSVPGLGTLTTSVTGSTDRAIVHRSWGLMNEGRTYGPKFQFYEYMAVRNKLVGFAVHISIAIGMVAIALSPVRWLLRKIVCAPGQGPSKAETKLEHVEYRAIATADLFGQQPSRAFARMKWNGGMYHLTGVLLAEAAMVILREETVASNLGGGLLTPATLGQPFIERLRQTGLLIEVETMPQQ